MVWYLVKHMDNFSFTLVCITNKVLCNFCNMLVFMVKDS
jgi:hypothetical protein